MKRKTLCWLLAIACGIVALGLACPVGLGRASASTSWTQRMPAGDADRNWMASVVDNSGLRMLAADNGGHLWQTGDAGTTWIIAGAASGTIRNWQACACDADGSTLLAAVYAGRLYRSRDAGASWVETQPAGSTNQNWKCVASSADGSLLMAGVYGGRLWVSSNGGLSWSERRPAGNTSQNWQAVASDASGTHLLAAVRDRRAYASEDAGITWHETQPAGDTNRPWKACAVSGDGTVRILASYPSMASPIGRLYQSSGAGASWAEVRPAGDMDFSWQSVAVDGTGTHIVAVVDGGAVWTSSDDGVSWSNGSPSGLPATAWQCCASNADGKVLAVGANAGRLYIGAQIDTVQVAVILSPMTVSAVEGGTSGSYTVSLHAPPTASVNVAVAGDSQVTAVPPLLAFTTANWSTPQTVAVTAVDDSIAEGIHTGTVTHTVTSADPSYNGLAAGGVTVNIADNDFSLTVNTIGLGSVSRDSDQTAYTQGTLVQVDATPAAGWHFTGWSGDLTGNANPANVIMTAHKTVTASFTMNTYMLTYTAGTNGTITGTSPQVVNYDTSGTAVTAVPNTGYHFVQWTDGVLTATRIDTNVTTDHAIAATFAINTYTLSMNVSGSGSVTKSPDQAAYSHGTTVVLTANAGAGWLFVGWSGDAAGLTNPIGVVMTQNVNVFAWFAPVGISTDTIAPTLVVHGPRGSTATGVAGSVYPPVAFSETVNRTGSDIGIDASDAGGFVEVVIRANATEIKRALQSGMAHYTVHLADGTNDMSVTATDAAGNTTTARFALVVDTVGPIISLQSVPVTVSTATVTIRGSVVDAVSGVDSALVDGVEALKTNGDIACTVRLSAGVNHLRVAATDKAGKTSTQDVTVTYAPAVKNPTVLQLTIGKLTMYVDGVAVKLDAAPVIRQSHTMLPIRAIAEAINAKVLWDARTRKVTIVRNKTTIEMWIGKSMARVNGKSVRIDAENAKVLPFIVNGRTMLPVRFVGETLGLDVEWNASIRLVTLTLWP